MRSGPRRARRVGALLPAVALAQVLLGAWTVWSLIAVPVVSLHLGFGALLLAGTVTLFLLLGPQPAPAAARRGSTEPGLMPAAG
jgi:heme A synthase